MEKAIRLEEVSFKYAGAETESLKRISLEVEKGGLVGIAGRSGCGKSTLLYCMNGIVPHAIDGDMEGRAVVCGLDVAKAGMKEIASRAGMVFQNPEVQLFNVTVEDEVAFVAENLNYPEERIRECVEHALESLGIGELRGRYPFELSGGEKQKVAIASAIAVRPEVLLLDEPTSELDAAGRDAVLKAVAKLREEGMTAVLAEHNMDEAAGYMDRLIVLDGGEVAADGPPGVVFKKGVFKRMRLRAPESVEVGLKLGPGNGLPLTVESAVKILAGHINDIKIERSREFNANGSIAIDVKELCYRKNGRTILDGVCLTLREGELAGLVGRNGSGKTTLALLLAGLLKPSAGSIFMSDKNKKVGLLFQNPEHQLFCDTVASEIAYGMGKRADVEHILEEMGLKRYEKRHPLALSRGERQRVASAAVVASKPDILVIDEPTTGQDWGHVRSFMETVQRLNKMGKTILMITHDMRVVAEYCPRLIVMMDGKIVLDGDTRSVFSRPEALKKAGLRPAPVSEISMKAGIIPPLLRLDELVVEEGAKCPD